MKTGSTILITGGGSGIGRSLAEALHAAGHTIIIAGRRLGALDEVVAANLGMAAAEMDVADPASIATGVAAVLRDHPALDAIIHNAGIMRRETLASGDTTAAEETIATNLLGPIRLTAALLPHLLAQPEATIVTVSSGLAFVPMALVPTYCATKAAIHSWSQSLREQLKATAVKVVEIVPPYVQTELLSPGQASDPRAMPLADFTAEVMALLAAGDDEVVVERATLSRFAAETGRYTQAFAAVNAMAH